jgi:ribonuclease Z
MYAGNALPFGAHQPPPPPPPMYVTPPGAHPPPPPLYTTHGFYPPYSRPPGGASPTPPPPPPTQTQRLVASLGLSKLETVPVEHCPEASAIIVASNAAAGAPGGSGFGADFSLCYSGDCRPSPRLAQSARGVHVFIHEATFGKYFPCNTFRRLIAHT